MKKETTKGALAVIALLALTATSGSAWALGNVNTHVTNNMNKFDQRDQSMKVGGSQNSNNRSSSITNRNDNRVDSRSVSSTSIDSRNMSDNRVNDFSNRSTWTDSSNRSTNDSHNVSTTNDYSIKAGDNSNIISGGYKVRAGHGSVKQGPVSGSNNVLDNSVSGYFGIGNTVQAKQ